MILAQFFLAVQLAMAFGFVAIGAEGYLLTRGRPDPRVRRSGFLHVGSALVGCLICLLGAGSVIRGWFWGLLVILGGALVMATYRSIRLRQ